MSSLNPSEFVARRRDELSDWHDIVAQSCADCGCELFVAKDDPSIVWEPGLAWALECTDKDCHCHLDPMIGERRGD